MFSGTYFNTLDTKGRIIIPSKFRDELAGRFMLTKGLDGCLFIFTMDEWNTFRNRIKDIPISDSGGRAFIRFFFASAVECSLDKQGRIKIPQPLLDYADIVRDVVTLGVDSRVELWSREVWDAYSSTDDFSSESIAENMKKLGV